MKVKIRSSVEFAEDMKKYSKEELIRKMLNMRSFILELVGNMED